ncbi:MAG TPA: hypothetical protein VH351_17000 [Bryobacteraceae bacterium]|jgi:hypothetical protein|nr:hypothetical protein [Bryobacteraceae bacterium]
MQDNATLTGTLRGLQLFDIAESIDLQRLQSIIGTIPRREPAFRHPAPDYVRFERPPITQTIGTQRMMGADVEVRIRYFDYGVASIELKIPFRAGWHELLKLANGWMLSPDMETFAEQILRGALAKTGETLIKPHEKWISEDYYIVQVDPVRQGDANLSAEDLLRDRGEEIAQLVRGETQTLSAGERLEVLQSSISYYPTDLLVVAWVAAFLYDTPQGATPTVDLLEYANTQLLEFRYYDEVLTKVLSDVYKQLEHRHTMWARWKMARQAETLNTIRLDFEELAERTENAIKFLSDMFNARLYRLAAARIGVSDYRSLVTEKLNTARDLYESMVNEFHQGRAFFLELMVVVILLVEIMFLFWHKPV